MSQKKFTEARTVAMTALLADPEIKDFVDTNFPGLSLRVFREIDPAKLPGSAKCPFIGFGPFTHGQAQGDKHAIEHAMPMGVFLDKSCGYEEDVTGGYVLPAAELADELAGLAEKVVTHALLEAGFAFDQDEAAAPDGVDWSRYYHCFYTYRVRTTRRINL